MADALILERKDRDGGLTHLWVSYDGERCRFAISTATLDGPAGYSTVKLMADRAISDVRAARERGRLQLAGADGDSSV